MTPVTTNSHSRGHYRCPLSPRRTPTASALVAGQPESTRGASRRENERSHATPPPCHPYVLGRNCRTRVPPPLTHALQSGCPTPSTFTTTPTNADKKLPQPQSTEVTSLDALSRPPVAHPAASASASAPRPPLPPPLLLAPPPHSRRSRLNSHPRPHPCPRLRLSLCLPLCLSLHPPLRFGLAPTSTRTPP